MKNEELNKISELAYEELGRRKRVKELFETDTVKEYLEKSGTRPKPLESERMEDILKPILRKVKITESNGIYVCTKAYCSYCEVTYGDDYFYNRNVPIDYKEADSKVYKDIETGRVVEASKYSNNGLSIIDFERKNIVLNPYNDGDNQNGYEEVRLDFIAEAIEYGQEKSKKKILTKYPRL